MDTGFLSLPMTAGRRDIAVAEDDAGNPVYMTPFGQRYTIRRQNPAQGSRVKAGLEVLKEASKAPLESLTAAAQAMAQGTWDAISAPGRSWSDSTMTYGDVANTAGLVSLPAVAGKYDPAVANMGIRAYHGSPHDFDRFDMSKIGTGEGAQAYGHGLYFAEAEDVAGQYRQALSHNQGDFAKIGGRDLNDIYSEIDAQASRLPPSRMGPEYEKLSVIEALMLHESPSSILARADDMGLSPSTVKWIEKDVAPNFKAGGHMYEVDINADPADFLDWDAPLSGQPNIMARIDADNSKYIDAAARINIGDLDALKAMTGSEYYNAVSGSPSSRARELNSGMRSFQRNDGTWNTEPLGIPGIKYYDQGSRASGQGTRNYVVFDDSLIEILRKYGVAGLAPLGATLAGSDQAQY